MNTEDKLLMHRRQKSPFAGMSASLSDDDRALCRIIDDVIVQMRREIASEVQRLVRDELPKIIKSEMYRAAQPQQEGADDEKGRP